ncbi:hypothetical protein DUNSADRAFT_8494 [Dunaliella salina]|uniref:Encoded protein n=1 Tax=Dunaliella salina TaxID=3046 RepID=A0ABQ7GJD3_DUNSA|nr:hypothetical protein DUNSADRAFT_8494 [Dunaliella salina]|eukprot:KAF5834724.1 hypothetical protein DUNSADRAFT_8494 [Dunaliella salina]
MDPKVQKSIDGVAACPTSTLLSKYPTYFPSHHNARNKACVVDVGHTRQPGHGKGLALLQAQGKAILFRRKLAEFCTHSRHTRGKGISLCSPKAVYIQKGPSQLDDAA